jgi:hypothetical protein
MATVVASSTLLGAGGLGLVAARPAAAENPTIVVTTTADVIDGGDGVLSLREAVIQANTDAGADTIELAAGATYDITQCDAGGVHEDAGVSGDLDVAGPDGLTILATGSTVRQTCASGDGVLDNHGADLVVDHGTIFRTFVGTSYGIRTDGGHLTVRNGSVVKSIVGGPGIAVTSGSVEVDDSTIQDNLSGIGYSNAWSGGTWDAVIQGSTITNNQAEGVRATSLAMSSSTVHANGGIGVIAGSATVSTSEISNNGTDDPDGYNSGGLFVEGALSLSGSQIIANLDRTGAVGGVRAGAGSTIDGSIVADNRIDRARGFIELPFDAGGVIGVEDLTITNSSITGNSGAVVAGGLHARTLTMSNSVVDGNTGQTGGVQLTSGSITSSTVSHNDGTGVSFTGNVTIERSTIVANQAYQGANLAGAPATWDGTSPDPHLELRQSTVVGGVTSGMLSPTQPLPGADLTMATGSASVGSSIIGNGASEHRSCQVPSNTGFQSLGGNVLADTSCTASSAFDLVGVGDPMLSALGDHGGPTPTMAPLAGSPVIDRIPVGPACTGTDQRGVSRPQGPACDVGAVESDATLYPDGSTFTPLDPVRVLDTRNGTGGLAPLGSTPESLVVSGTHGVPADATAVVLNVTVTDVLTPTFVTVFPGGGQLTPNASNLNLAAGQTAANLVTVKLGGGGAVSFANANGTVNVIADLVGYDAAAPEGTSSYTSIAPERLADSRQHTTLDTFTPHGVQSMRVAGGATPVPPEATAVVVNITGTDVSAPTFVTAYPKGGSTPTASNLNLGLHETRANLAIVKVGADHAISLFNDSGSVNVIVDVVGYFTPGDHHAAFVGLSPTRLIDTRTSGHIGPLHTFGADESQAFTATGGAVPVDATAVVVNVTVTDSVTGTFVTVYPTPDPVDLDPPKASNVNVGPYQTNPNLVIVKVGTDGKVSIYNRLGSANVIVDLVGYYR